METVRVDTNVGETPLFDALQARLGAEQVVRERLDVGDVVLSAGGDTLLIERNYAKTNLLLEGEGDRV